MILAGAEETSVQEIVLAFRVQSLFVGSLNFNTNWKLVTKIIFVIIVIVFIGGDISDMKWNKATEPNVF